jgi:hypothetical protein
MMMMMSKPPYFLIAHNPEHASWLREQFKGIEVVENKPLPVWGRVNAFSTNKSLRRTAEGDE